MSTNHVDLFNEKREDDAEYDKRLFEQYKMYVELADRISQRRSIANSFFITVTAALLAGTSWLHTSDGYHIYLISLAGILVSVFWYYCIRSYGQLNSGKFRLIHEIEQHLPLNLFSYEWTLLGQGESRKKYWPLSHIERAIPCFFVILYIALILFSLCS